MPRVPQQLRALIRRRADETCEYCRMPERLYRFPFQPINDPLYVQARAALIEEGVFPPS